ncbi:DHBK, partial [Symbiodinium sp. KB8]
MATLIMNDATSIVHDALEGFVMMHPELALLDALEQDIKVVLRKDWDPACGKVALISGGGSGHEPSHAGWVGRGMLTAAVCGDVFASPSVDAVTAAIHAVAGPGQSPDAASAATAPAPAGSAPGHPGVCLIIKNYGGDRLNFGLAAERARAAGIPTRTVVVADDCALKGAGATGRRGVAGTVLVHKVAGAVAEAGGSLEEVAAAAERAAAAVATLGVATSTCSVPGRPHDPRLDAVGTFEVGLGIHGEPGKAQVTGMTARDVAATCVDGIRQRKAEDSPAWAAAAAEHGL